MASNFTPPGHERADEFFLRLWREMFPGSRWPGINSGRVFPRLHQAIRRGGQLWEYERACQEMDRRLETGEIEKVLFDGDSYVAVKAKCKNRGGRPSAADWEAVETLLGIEASAGSPTEKISKAGARRQM